MRVTAAALGVLLLATIATAADPGRVYRELDLGADPSDPAAVTGAKARLSSEEPDFWEVPLPAGPLGQALADSLLRGELLALFARAARDA